MVDFKLTKQGRTLFLTETEKFCCHCKSKENKEGSWYYYDYPLAQGLYCRKCAIGARVHVSFPKEKTYQFWLIDKFRYGVDGDSLVVEDS